MGRLGNVVITFFLGSPNQRYKRRFRYWRSHAHDHGPAHVENRSIASRLIAVDQLTGQPLNLENMIKIIEHIIKLKKNHDFIFLQISEKFKDF